MRKEEREFANDWRKIRKKKLAWFKMKQRDREEGQKRERA